MTSTDKAPERICADVIVWGDMEPLAGEWNCRDVGRPEDTEYVRADLHDAAQERIAELEGERRARHANPGDFRYWEGRWRDEAAENDQLRAENERLREALEPFAKAGELFPEAPGSVEFDLCIYRPAAGSEWSLFGDDLRRARAALTQPSGEPK